MANGSIQLSVGFNVDKTAINQLKTSLQEIQRMTQHDLNLDDSLNAKQAAIDLEAVKKTAKEVENALDKAFNKNLGTLNVSKFNQSLKQLDLQKIYTQFNSIGSVGQAAFRNMTTEILTTNLQLKQSHKFLNEIATTMGNTIKWGMASSIMNSFSGSIQQAYGYVKALDSSLNDIRIVTGKSSEEMAEFARQANKAAQSLGQGTKDYTEASLIYYQQGLNDAEASARAETTLKAANVTGQSTAAVSEQLTAVWNGYKVSSQEAELYVDKLAAVAATTASDLEELSVGMSKVASAANAMGVDVDSLNAQLATIISVTRQAPESAGTALKTIYARMGDIEAGLDGEVTLDEYTSKMADMGVNVLNANGHLRDMGDVINEIGGNWENLSREQQIALSQIMAGTRQYNNLLALFDNWDMYTDALNTSANAAGTLQQQQDIYMESTEAHLQQLGTAMEDVYDSMFNTESFNKLLDIITLAVNGLADFVDGIGGGGNALLALGSIATTVFSKQISSGIVTTISNFKALKDNTKQVNDSMDLLKQFKTVLEDPLADTMTKEIVKLEEKIMSLKEVLTPEDFNKLQDYVKGVNAAAQKVHDFKMQQDKAGTIAQGFFGEGIQQEQNETGEGSAPTWSKIAEIGKQAREANTELNNTNVSIEEIFKTLKKDEENRDYFTNLEQSLIDADKLIQDVKNKIKSLNQKSMEEFNKDSFIENFGGLTNEISASNLVDENTRKVIAQAYNEIINPTDAVNQTEAGRNALIGQLRAALLKAAEQMGEGGEKLKQIVKDTWGGVGEVLEEEAKDMAKNAPIQQFINQLDVKKIVDFASGVGQIASSIKSLTSGVQAFLNEDLEPMEKFSQLISGLAMGLPILYSGITMVLPALEKMLISFGVLGAEAQLAIGPVFLAILGLTTAFMFLSDRIVTSKEAVEKFNEALGEYDEVTQELEGLKSKIEETNEKLDELYSKDKLTIADEEEIARLEAENAELERQVELQEKLQSYKEAEVVETGKEAVQSGAYSKELKNIQAAQDNGEISKEEADKQRTEFFAENYQTASKTYEHLNKNPESNKEELAELQKFFVEEQKLAGTFDKTVASAFDSMFGEGVPKETLQKYKDILTEYKDLGKDGWTEEDFAKINEEQSESGVNFSSEKFESLKQAADNAKFSIDDVINGITELDEASNKPFTDEVSDMVSSISEQENGIDLSGKETGLNLMMEDLVREGFDVSTITEALETIDWSQIDFSKIDLSTPEGLAEAFTLITSKVRETATEIDKVNEKTAAMGELSADAEAYDLDYKELETYRRILEETNEELQGQEDLLTEATTSAKRFQRGIDNLGKDWDDLNKIMSDNNASIEDVTAALEDVNPALQDMLDYSDEEFELLPADFAQKHWDKITDVVNGVEGAYEDLLALAGQEIVFSMELDPDAEANLVNAINGITDVIDVQDLEVGATLDDTGYTNALNEMLLKGDATAEQISAALEGIQFDPDISEKTLTMDDMAQMTASDTITVTDDEGNTKVLSVSDARTAVSNGTTFKIPVLNGKSSTYKGPSVSARAGGSSKKPSGGGGGGGGGGSKKPKKEKPIESKKDRYHDVNAKLSQIDEELEDIGRDQEKLFGKDLLNALNKELEVLEKQRDVLKEKLDIARDEQAELRAKLALKGVTFNEDGTIANYLTIVAQKEAELNALIEQYNSMSAEEQETFQEEVLDPAKEAYEELIETMEEYDTVITDTIPEIENAIQDAIDREVEINIKKLNMEVELRLDLSEAQKDWNEFKRKVIDGIKDDDIFGTAQSIKDLYGDLVSNGTLEAGTANINTTIAEINKMNSGQTSDIYGDDKQAALDNLEEQMKNLMDTLETLTDLQEGLAQKYLESIDKVGEAFDEQIASYEYVGELIEHNLNLAKLIKGEDAFADFDAIYKQQEQNNLSTLASQKQAVDYYRQMMETEQDPEALKKWTELWKESVSTLNSTVESSVELVIEKYSNTINIIFDEMDKALTNGKGLDYMTLQWELVNDNADAYLDTINAAYEVQKLERSVIESLNNTDSLYAQKKLNDFMEDELKMLREKEKLTQYDVDRANALYDIKLKEIALEEAQQNKSQMRLRRDSSGNYSYQFVADQDSISQAQQELDDAKNSLYNMDKDAYRENQQAILDAYTEYQEKMRDAANLSAEERELIEEQYNEKINNLLEENNVIRNNLGESAFAELAQLYASDEANFRTMSQNERDVLIGEIIPHWNDGLNEMIDKMAGEDGFATACKNAMEQLEAATVEYDNSLKLIETTAGQSFGNLAENQAENIKLAKDLAEAAQEVVKQAIAEKDAVDLLKESVDAVAKSYEAVEKAAKDALTAAQALMEFEKKKAADAAAEEARKQAEEAASSGGQGSADDGSSGGGSSAPTETPDNSNLAEGVAASIWLHGANASGWGKGATRAQRFNEKGVSAAQALLNKAEWNNDKTLYNNWIGRQAELKKYYYKAFDTGGYTGEWGDEGKLAVLHEKELILNKDDTKNILTAVSLARTMDSILSSLNDSIVSRVSSLTSMLTASSNVGNSGPQEIQQNVSIEANFPNVSSRTEIEDAFKNLVNVASQHAFNTQR